MSEPGGAVTFLQRFSDICLEAHCRCDFFFNSFFSLFFPSSPLSSTYKVRDCFFGSMYREKVVSSVYSMTLVENEPPQVFASFHVVLCFAVDSSCGDGPGGGARGRGGGVCGSPGKRSGSPGARYVLRGEDPHLPP